MRASLVRSDVVGGGSAVRGGRGLSWRRVFRTGRIRARRLGARRAGPHRCAVGCLRRRRGAGGIAACRRRLLAGLRLGASTGPAGGVRVAARRVPADSRAQLAGSRGRIHACPIGYPARAALSARLPAAWACAVAVCAFPTRVGLARRRRPAARGGMRGRDRRAARTWRAARARSRRRLTACVFGGIVSGFCTVATCSFGDQAGSLVGTISLDPDDDSVVPSPDPIDAWVTPLVAFDPGAGWAAARAYACQRGFSPKIMNHA